MSAPMCTCWHDTSEHEQDGDAARTGPCMVAIADVRYVDGHVVQAVLACPCDAFTPLSESDATSRELGLYDTTDGQEPT